MKKIIAVSSLYLLPVLALAQVGTQNTPTLSNIQTLIQRIGQLVDLLIPVVLAIALLLFFWGMAKFIMSAGNEEAREQGRGLMIWGIIAFVVMLSIWGIVTFIQNALGINGSFNINIPQVGNPGAANGAA